MELGKKQTLVVVKKVDFGVYLAEERGAVERVLLPAKQVPEGTQLGDQLEVFLYKDSQDRLISTTTTPYITMGEIAVLKVVQVNRVGAFLDWGLEKDLFLPFKEQLRKVEQGDEVLVRLYIDKSSRLSASMKGIYHLLQTDAPYEKGETVTGRVYEFGHDFGTFVAIDDKYSAMIPAHEDASNLKIGQIIEAKVTAVKPDGKLDITIRDKAYIQIDADSEKILKIIEEYGGVLPFNDKASPETIKRVTGLSKNAFKRGVGRLYKERIVEITEKSIRIVK